MLFASRSNSTANYLSILVSFLSAISIAVFDFDCVAVFGFAPESGFDFSFRLQCRSPFAFSMAFSTVIFVPIATVFSYSTLISIVHSFLLFASRSNSTANYLSISVSFLTPISLAVFDFDCVVVFSFAPESGFEFQLMRFRSILNSKVFSIAIEFPIPFLFLN